MLRFVTGRVVADILQGRGACIFMGSTNPRRLSDHQKMKALQSFEMLDITQQHSVMS